MARKFLVAGVLVLTAVGLSTAASGAQTGPVERKWGLGWDYGLTARLWLGGVWELAVAAGPSDHLRDRESHVTNTGREPDWVAREYSQYSDDHTESGFARVQAGRLVSRRGPLSLVCYTGLLYQWIDGKNSQGHVETDSPDDSYSVAANYDNSTWIVSLGIRPSVEVLDFLTIETAFGLNYRWYDSEGSDRREYGESGQVVTETRSEDGSSFDDFGWYGMGSLQFIVWF